MATIAQWQYALNAKAKYEATAAEPLTPCEVYGPMTATIFSTVALGTALLTGYAAATSDDTSAVSPATWTKIAGSALAAAAAPVYHYGQKIITDWTPQLAWFFPKGEIQRKLTGVPQIYDGFAGWEKDCTHSNHFNKALAEGIVGLCLSNNLKTAADFDCGGQGKYPKALQKGGIETDGFDFSEASVAASNGELQKAKVSSFESDKKSDKTYDFVSSFEVLSKAHPEFAETFVEKIANIANPNGMIAISCAVPGQPGPNCTHLTNEAVIALFEKEGCTYDPVATGKLKRIAADSVQTWYANSLMVFRKNDSAPVENKN